MLQEFSIRDMAIINEVTLQFKNGMTVLTGETGAGKSILVDALGLILGDRADNNLIRAQTKQAVVTAVFSLDQGHQSKRLLESLDITDTDELIIRRNISKDGRSRAYINDMPVSLQSLKQISTHLLEIHGQNTNQLLTTEETQLELLDQFAGNQAILKTLGRICQQWQEIQSELNQLTYDHLNLPEKIALIRYQIEDLQAAELTNNSYAELSEQYKRAANVQNLLNTCGLIADELEQSDDAVNGRLAKYYAELSAMCRFDNQLEATTQLINDALIQLKEASNELSAYTRSLNTDPELLKQYERQIENYHELSRKYQCAPELLMQHLESLENTLGHLEKQQHRYQTLLKQKEALLIAYRQQAQALSEKRHSAAEKFVIEINQKLNSLALNGEFQISLEDKQYVTPSHSGQDKITFLTTLNPGQPLYPISKVASGGELSRLSLAIKVIANKNHASLLFDEIDSGISGRIAEIVGKEMFGLARQQQVFCITHLPQVATFADHHYRVCKTVRDGTTFAEVTLLNEEQKISEIASMLTGSKTTEESLANAVKIIEHAKTLSA